MRKIALLTLLAAVSFSLRAEGPAGMFSYDGLAFEKDVHAGAGLSWMSYVPEGDLSTTPAARPGCSVGAGVAMKILQGLYLRGELDVSLRRSGNSDLDVNYNPVYACLPVTLELRVPLCDHLDILASGGFWGACGLGGSSVNGTVKTPFFGSDADNFAVRPDYGWTAGLGCIICGKVRVSAAFGYGIKDIANSHTLEVGHFYNNYLSFGLGYIF